MCVLYLYLAYEYHLHTYLFSYVSIGFTSINFEIRLVTIFLIAWSSSMNRRREHLYDSKKFYELLGPIPTQTEKTRDLKKIVIT